jgi:dTDP-4-amino-4,6-dideoxygalactose transaminase
MGVFSFNGNKIITTGGGGLIVTNDSNLADKCKHLTTTAKTLHSYEFIHDEIGYNFRMPNINAALGCGQMENLNILLNNKRKLAHEYIEYFESIGINFRKELPGTKANYWLMCLEFEDKKERDLFLKETNEENIMTRPIWQLIFKNTPYKDFQTDSQKNAIFLQDRIVNIPSNL